MTSSVRFRVFFLFSVGYFDSYMFRGVNLGFAAVGIGVFGTAHGIGAMMLGRLLIGVGVSVCMSAAFKALAQILPVAQLPMVNGLVMEVGGLGGVVVGSPLTILLGVTDWRNVCYCLVAMTLTVAAAIFLFAPEHRDGVHRKADMLTQFKGTWHILGSGAFWKIASFSVVTQGVFLRDAVALDKALFHRCHGSQRSIRHWCRCSVSR